MRREDFSMRRLFALRHELSGVLLPPEVHDSVDVPLPMVMSLRPLQTILQMPAGWVNRWQLQVIESASIAIWLTVSRP